ncbi:2-alkenal reductase (NADP(+)-dependent)-like [Iris pallida]|uniref:2-alkenal reductase (NADP(+)-dependent)-like n=1 Tax=Iris pallida TaxID=29817 RepID=A0AAX6DM96_IRIPA|nr:2-alkenal reductase (NADP(+)-dependent)-like [Iris pallida]
MEVENIYVTIKDHIDGHPSESNFELRSAPLSLSIEEGTADIIVKNIYLSIDPYQLNRMKRCSSSQNSVKGAAQLVPGKEIDAIGIGRVVASGNDEFKKDDMVYGQLAWQEYTVVHLGTVLTKIDKPEFPLSYYLGPLGISGFTAYAGLYDICKVKNGEKVFVSTTSGSVGNLVGQFAKLSGCYVVGSTGSKSKVDMLKEKLGFDEAFNYKEEPDLNSALRSYFPEGIDVYFDNVGAEMLEAAVANMNPFGRVAACGAISEYTEKGRRAAAPNMIDVIYKRINIRGYLVSDYFGGHLQDEFLSATADHVRHGLIHVLEDVSRGVESIPSAFAGLFRGDNVGKKLVQVSEF